MWGNLWGNKIMKFLITTDFVDKRVTIEVEETIIPFVDLMMATEFMIYKTAQQSEAGFEKAMELLCKGAMTYRDRS